MKTEKIKTLAITGASSYIGKNLIRLCLDNDINVKAFCRDISKFDKNFLSNKNLSIFDYEVSKKNILEFNNVDGIIHLAHERVTFPRKDIKEDNNVLAAHEIIENAKKYNINRIIYLSSHLAHSETYSQYGKSKLLCERIFLKNNYIVLKAGFVFGGEISGFLEILISQFKNKIFPIIFPNAPIYPIHVDDLNRSLLLILNMTNQLKDKYTLGLKVPIKLKDFFNKMCVKYCSKKINLIILPGNIIFKLSYIIGYFSSIFNKIYERTAGVKSLIVLDTDKQITDEIDYLRNTKFFLNNDN
jgi:nucleoside-diphosphate-sugar epimerase